MSGCCRSARRIGDRYDRERADREGQAEPKQAIANKDMRCLVAEAGHTNNPERKKNIAMKKLSVASTTASKPIQDLGSV